MPKGTIQSVDNSVQLSRNQKRRKAKKKTVEDKIAIISHEIKPEEEKNQNNNNIMQIGDNPFAELLRKVCKLTFQDNLISKTKEIIDIQLGFVKLSDDEIKAVIEMNNCNELNDWWTKAWAFKSKILEKWFLKYVDSFFNKNNCMDNEEINRRAKN